VRFCILPLAGRALQPRDPFAYINVTSHPLRPSNGHRAQKVLGEGHSGLGGRSQLRGFTNKRRSSRGSKPYNSA
jgi:hypothetical protein